MPNPLGKYGDMLVKGLVSQAAPSIAQGVLVELLRKRKLDVAKASRWVQANRSLWNDLEPQEQESLKKLAGKVGDLSWMTTEWAINSLKQEMPSIASLFLGWRRGHSWLEHQIKQVREEIKG